MKQFSLYLEDYALLIHENTLNTPTSTWKVDAHLHSFYELHYILNGYAKLFVDGKTVTVQQNQLIFINKNVLHYTLSHSDDLKFVSISFDLEKLLDKTNFCDKSSNYDAIKNCIYSSEKSIVFDDNVLKCTFLEFYDKNERSKLNSVKHVISIAYLRLINRLFELNVSSEKSAPIERSGKYKNEIIKIDKFISEHYMEDISIDDLAKLFYLSKRQMTRIFEDLIGESFHKSLLRQRMNVALMHIKNNTVPLTEIPYLCGFNSYSGFYLAFKNFYGVPPQKYYQMTDNKN